jgi:hypothetical protein
MWCESIFKGNVQVQKERSEMEKLCVEYEGS